MAQQTEYQKEYYLRNKERIQARDKARSKELKEYRRKHYQENKERIDAVKKIWRDKNREKYLKDIKEYSKEWYQANKNKRLRQINEWRKNNKEKYRLWRNSRSKSESLKRRHGITLECFNEMFSQQNGICAICSGQFKNEKDKCIDHCHHTGKIRSILCFNCNIGIGKFKDSIELLEKALEYLKCHSNSQTPKKQHFEPSSTNG